MSDKEQQLTSEGNPGEWMAAQIRLIRAGLRNKDRVTIKTAYKNITKRFGEETADLILFDEYTMHQQFSEGEEV